MNRQHMLANEHIGRLLWKLSMPAIVGMLVQATYNIVDTIFIGHSVGELGIAGLSIVFPIQMFISAIGQMIGVGAASLISIAIGAHDKEKAHALFGNALSLSLIFGVLITMFCFPFANYLLTIFGSSKTILPYADQYMSIIIFGSVFATTAMVMNNIVRAEGNAKTAMIVMLLSAILNIILDPILIFAMHLGIQGAAIATVISQFVAAFYLTYYFYSGKSLLKIKLSIFKLDFSIVSKIISIGISPFIRIASGSLIMIILNTSLGLYGGDMAIAIYGILNRVFMFALMPILGLAQGLQPILGFNYGAKRFDRTKLAIKKAFFYASIISVIEFLIVVIFPHQVIEAFTANASLIHNTSYAMMFIASSLSLLGFIVVGTYIFQSMGKARPTFFLSIMRRLVFFIPLLIILPKFYKLTGIWISFPIADLLAFAVTLIMVVIQMRTFKQELDNE